MQDFDKTTFFAHAAEQTVSSLVTIFDDSETPRTVNLSEYGKNFIYLGRDPKNDIILSSRLDSAKHGRFVYKKMLGL
ncbi:MAG: hypothetical protein IJA55_06320 [Clostridia bacterium]|nr:hypothetical protein [Clostridia bacterium]